MAKVDLDKVEDTFFYELQELLLSLDLTWEQYVDLIHELVELIKSHLEYDGSLSEVKWR